MELPEIAQRGTPVLALDVWARHYLKYQNKRADWRHPMVESGGIAGSPPPWRPLCYAAHNILLARCTVCSTPARSLCWICAERRQAAADLHRGFACA